MYKISLARVSAQYLGQYPSPLTDISSIMPQNLPIVGLLMFAEVLETQQATAKEGKVLHTVVTRGINGVQVLVEASFFFPPLPAEPTEKRIAQNFPASGNTVNIMIVFPERLPGASVLPK